jgi:hypothetical protein
MPSHTLCCNSDASSQTKYTFRYLLYPIDIKGFSGTIQKLEFESRGLALSPCQTHDPRVKSARSRFTPDRLGSDAFEASRGLIPSQISEAREP